MSNFLETFRINSLLQNVAQLGGRFFKCRHTLFNIAIFSFKSSRTYLHQPETINESLLMNKIVGRVADRSACNRKENRIKRALNGAIIRGNGDEGAQRNAQSGLRRVVIVWYRERNEDVSGYRGRRARQSQKLRRPRRVSWCILSPPPPFTPLSFSLLSVSVWLDAESFSLSMVSRARA